MESRTRGQGHRKNPRPRTDTLEAKDTSASALQKKKGPHKGDLQKKKVFTKIFQALHKILTNQKIVLSSSRGQANFRGLGASRPRTSKCVLEDSTSGSNYFVLEKSAMFLWVFLSTEFPTCLTPPSRDNHRQASYLRTQQRDQGAG